VADRPNKVELLEAIRHFLAEELLPELEGVRRFHTRVAVNALGILARELDLEGDSLARRHEALAELLGESAPGPADPEGLSRAVDDLERRLVERIRGGDADGDPFRDQVLRYLALSVRERLAVNNPRYS
jgi:hypothetical protein